MKQWNRPVPVALPITMSELIEMGIDVKEIESGEVRGVLKTYGPWQLPVTYKALAMSCVYTSPELQKYSAERESVVAYGLRTLSNCRQNGYCLEGFTSIGGKKYSAFTSSQLFELENSKLVDVAIIHVRMRKE